MAAVTVKSQDLTTLSFSDAALAPPNTSIFDIRVGAYWQQEIKEVTGQKLEIPKCEVFYNGEALQVKTCKTRGSSTLNFVRKSFLVSLDEPIDLAGGEVEKLALNNLAMDHNYYRNRLSFLLMAELDLFPLRNQLTEVRVNGETAGIYLALQKVDDYTDAIDSPLLLRREYSQMATVEEVKDSKDKIHFKRLKQVKKLTKEFEGEVLFDTLNSMVFMDRYFRWLAFNQLILNGDYTDELFLYLHPEERKFDIIPWDYDDVFSSEPHEGMHKRNRRLDHQLLFSSEAYIDVIIDQDDYLYHRYLENFSEVLEVLSPEVLKRTFEQVYGELRPYYQKESIIEQSALDQYGLTNLASLEEDLQSQYSGLLSRRITLQSAIQTEQ